VTVWGKGAKERLVRFGPVTQAFLQEWLQGRKAGSLFGLNKWGIGEMLERLEKRTGIKCSAHRFRRTFATAQIRAGMNLFFVQSLLGHEDLTMTRIYAHQVNSEDAIRHYRPIVR
jgi:site-specific recombinase XerD